MSDPRDRERELEEALNEIEGGVKIAGRFFDFTTSRARILQLFRDAECEARGWKDIADSNRAAYESVLPSVQPKRVDVSDPTVCIQLAVAEGVQEIGAGIVALDPEASQ